jgi:hypothetical protein
MIISTWAAGLVPAAQFVALRYGVLAHGVHGTAEGLAWRLNPRSIQLRQAAFS